MFSCRNMENYINKVPSLTWGAISDRSEVRIMSGINSCSLSTPRPPTTSAKPKYQKNKILLILAPFPEFFGDFSEFFQSVLFSGAHTRNKTKEH